MNTLNPFATIDELRARTTEAIIGQSGLNHAGLNAEIRRRFACAESREGGVIQEPVLEAALPYVPADETLDDLSGQLLEPALVDALDGAETPDRPYRFRRTQHPYAHQLEAWRRLNDQETKRSVLVTSGTGSGKTECFLVPILNDLARQASASNQRLQGVQAIMLYPLNALIASQEERLRAWTEPFGGKVRFGLYNRMMPEQLRAAEASARPECVADRKTLRAAPPPILVTNVTMLEYMMLRPQDVPILTASQGKLRYVVLDEAHSYVGAQAAEIALLLRRVCLAFGVDPSEVRFVATSATIGSGDDVGASLGKFLADVSGAPAENVHVITGRQKQPTLPPLHAGGPIGEEAHYAHLGGHPAIRPLLEALFKGPIAWSAVRSVADRVGADPADLALKLAHARSTTDENLAPLRVHSFHRATPGLWSCLDPACSRHRPAEWPFGSIHHQPADVCGCGAPLFEIVSCSSCGEPFLDVAETPNQRLVAPRRGVVIDEFALDADADAPEVDEDEAAPPPQPPADRKLIALKPLKGPGARSLCVEGATGLVHDREGAAGVTTFFAYDRATPETCPACAARAGNGIDIIRPLRFGAPFILGNATPILLDGAEHPGEAADPAHWVEGAPPPLRGRQLLSFTDSRQGTARLAAKLQTGSERNFARSVIYHAVQDVLAQAVDSGERCQQDERILALRHVLENTPNPALEKMLADEVAKRASIERQGEAGLPWDLMVQRLAERPEVRVWIKRVWARRYSSFESETKLAEFLLLREFFRRPPRAVSPETLGLARLRFEGIDSIPDAATPSAFLELGGSAQDWRDYLCLLTTFLMRGRYALRVPKETLHWITPGVVPRDLAFAPQAPLATWEVLWPRFGARPVGNTPMIVNLLEQASGRSLDEPLLRETFQDVFTAAWAALGDIITLPGAVSRQIGFAKVHVAPVTTAWLCPVTRRLLDVTLKGLSPYGAKTRGAPPTPAVLLGMPRHPLPYAGQREGIPAQEAQATIKEWLERDSAIADLRARGAWGDISDRIALFSDYFRSAEHSAQQQPARLRRYETEFKAGAINVLNCSTTMEMGVDIGSVSHVMMTNLPPNIANYRQRVGRAGRRGQPLSMAFTFCKDRPLDRDAFLNPLRYLGREVRAPQVALSSSVIVQRHVNALLFAGYMREHGGNAMKMQAGPFFGCGDAIGAIEDADNAAARMVDWIRSPDTHQVLGPQVVALTLGTALEVDLGIYEAAAAALHQAREAFAAEWSVIQDLAGGVGANDKAARTRLEIHLRRLCQEFLLRVLPSRGFLPGHGFPTDVVSFVIRKENRRTRDPSEPEDTNRFNAYPQRSLDSAIREYAPGSEVVVDGLVYKSAGVTLNWKQPASESGVREIQALMWRWRCPLCGESGTIRHFDPDHRECPACGSGSTEWFEYLQPAGFAVDLRAEPHADADIVTYVAPEPTAVSAAGAPWVSLFDPARGRYRSAREGSVFYCNAGVNGTGYAICLACGRADAAIGVPHAQLLGKGECEGSLRSFARKDGLRLGHEIHTDVFEFQPAGWDQPGGALALAVALREALARRLGIEPDEMGLSANHRRDQLGGQTMSIFLHDKATGGAGFSIQAEELFAELIADAEDILDCNVPGCLRSCPACVLVGDLSEDQAQGIDRGPALQLIRQTLRADAAPEDIDRAATGARFSRDVLAELDRALAAGGKRMTLRLAGAIDPGALEHWSAVSLVERWRSRGRVIVLAIDMGGMTALDGAQKLGLRDLANRWGVAIEAGEAATFANGSAFLAEITNEDGNATVFATRDAVALDGGEGWGRPSHAPVVRFGQSGPAWTGVAVPLGRLQPDPGAKVLHVSRELDGRIGEFGGRMAATIRGLVLQLGVQNDDAVANLDYEDRYLRSPLTVRLLIDALGGLALGSGKTTPVAVRTIPLEPKDHIPRWLDNDWKSETDRAEVARALAVSKALVLDWRTDSAGHARRLTVAFASGRRVEILLDQGLGPWRCDRGTSFEFRAPPPEQASRLRRLETGLRVAPGARTFFVAEAVPGA
ncbi:MAG TPA: DEAD/DEAH box helicase [Caulobacteraceae bacterium]